MIESPAIEISQHPQFTKEIEKFNKKYHAENDYRHFINLLELHFNPGEAFTFQASVLVQVNNVGPNVNVYKVIMTVKGLRKSQCPRICLRFEGRLITLLCFDTHIDNYKDSELRVMLKVRIKELDPNVILS